MARKFASETLVIASHNPGKIIEMADLLRPMGINVKTAKEMGVSEPEETGTTFIANAKLKARTSAIKTQLPAFADDSGLVIPALDGQPGIYSARWGGLERDFAIAIKRVERELKARNVPSEGVAAYFVSALSLFWPDGHSENFEGEVHGKLTFPPRGTNGFGYDSIFIADGDNITFGEMNPEKKHSISHRSVAFNKLFSACFT